MPALHISSVTDIIIIHICMGMVCIATTTTSTSSEYVATHHGPYFYLSDHRMRLFVYAPSLHNINTVFLHNLVKSYINLSSSLFLFLLLSPNEVAMQYGTLPPQRIHNSIICSPHTPIEQLPNPTMQDVPPQISTRHLHYHSLEVQIHKLVIIA